MSVLCPIRKPLGVPSRQPEHPGRFLDRHFLRPLSLSQTAAAKQLGVSRRRVNELAQGVRAMSPDTALRCAILFGVHADFWLTLQANWDVFHAWRTMQAAASTRPLAGSTQSNSALQRIAT